MDETWEEVPETSITGNIENVRKAASFQLDSHLLKEEKQRKKTGKVV